MYDLFTCKCSVIYKDIAKFILQTSGYCILSLDDNHKTLYS